MNSTRQQRPLRFGGTSPTRSQRKGAPVYIFLLAAVGAHHNRVAAERLNLRRNVLRRPRRAGVVDHHLPAGRTVSTPRMGSCTSASGLLAVLVAGDRRKWFLCMLGASLRC